MNDDKREELKREWTAQDKILSYTDWLQDELIKARQASAKQAAEPERELKELREWKQSAMRRLAKSEKLKQILPPKYWGWDVYDATLDHIAELESKEANLADYAKRYFDSFDLYRNALAQRNGRCNSS